MYIYQLDPDGNHWGLPVLHVFHTSTGNSPYSIHYARDLSQVERVQEGYNETKHYEGENDEIIARALQEELSRLAAVEASGSSSAVEKHFQASFLAQDWQSPSSMHEYWNHQREAERNWSYSPQIASESILDGEVGKRFNQMYPIPHVPKINGEIPSVDEETSDHQRLLERLCLYDLVELKVQGDGNCQFRALSDQIYRTTEYHESVRQEVVKQLRDHRELYEGYVPMDYDDYLERMSRIGEWGDHVTLQAAAEAYGMKIFIMTSFEDTCYIEILPKTQPSRTIFLSFWAEVHYNSIYPKGD
ncbi:Ubiquitinyl hydrolase 1 [Bertholletia excelsa]